jgi:glutamate-1-semialdehyde 2,1-aminomutase
VISAVAGRADLMAPESPRRPSFIGTFNGHQTSLAAAHATLELLADGSIQRLLEERTQWLITEFNQMAAKFGVAAKMAGGGGHFHWYFTEKEVTDYRSAATSDPVLCQAFAGVLENHGVLCSPAALQHHAISAAHGDAELDFFLKAARAGFETLASLR